MHVSTPLITAVVMMAATISTINAAPGQHGSLDDRKANAPAVEARATPTHACKAAHAERAVQSNCAVGKGSAE